MVELILAPIADKSSRSNHTDSWRILKPEIVYDKCIRCMICWKFCPDNAFEISTDSSIPSPNERTAKLEAPVINYDYCKGCGICANECPEKCIEMTVESKRVI